LDILYTRVYVYSATSIYMDQRKNHNAEIEAIHILMNWIDDKPRTRAYYHSLVDLLMRICEEEDVE